MPFFRQATAIQLEGNPAALTGIRQVSKQRLAQRMGAAKTEEIAALDEALTAYLQDEGPAPWEGVAARKNLGTLEASGYLHPSCKQARVAKWQTQRT